MHKSILQHEVLPFCFWMGLLVVSTLGIDLVLHQYKMVWVGRYLGIPGTILIVLSFLYSLRKKKVITIGSPKRYLHTHEALSWIGALLLLIHSGIHFNALLPWLATISMFTAVGSGLIGKFILKRANQILKKKRKIIKKAEKTDKEMEQILYWDSLMVKAMKDWRRIHKPITILFGVFSVLHIGTIILFGSF